VAAKPHDVEARRGLVDALMELHMWTEADREARDGVAALPDDPELNRLAGEIATYRGDRARATPYLRKAVDLAPDAVPLRTRLGQHLLDLGQAEDAIRELARAHATDSSHWQAAYSLGQALLRAKRWAEALPALERVLSLRPDFATDQALLADIARCKRALSYPLSPAEEKASKRGWGWPFGRRRGSSKPSRGVPAWAILPVLGAAVLVALGVAVWRQQHVTVYFDNGLDAAVTIAIGPQSFSLAPQELRKRSLSPGSAEVVVTGQRGPIERTTVQVNALNLWDALFSSRFYVYNVAERHIYSRSTIAYTTSSRPSPGNAPPPQLIALQRFFVVDGVDHAFVTPPQQISSSSGSQVTTRTAFEVVRDLDFVSLAAVRMSEGRTAEAERAARKAVEIEGCALRARRTLAMVLLSGSQPHAALPEIEQWRKDCPGAGIELERTYQDVMRGTGRRDELFGEYRARIAQAPEDAAAHYLLGRLIDDPRASLEEQRAAVRLDPELVWAHVAMAYDLLALERPREAFDTMSAALGLPHESGVVLPFAHAAITSGRHEEAKTRLEEMSRRAPRDPALIEARWLIALARRAWPEAAQLDVQLARLTQDEEESMTRKATAAALQREGAGRGTAPAAAVPNPNLALTAAEIQFCRLAEQRLHKEAVAALDRAYARARSQVPPVLQLHAASELLMAGEKERANERLKAVEASLEQAPAEPGVFFLRSGASVLRGATPGSQVIEAARQSEYLSLDDAYYWAGVRAKLDGRADVARQHWQRSASLCCDFRFPYLAARRLAGSSEKK
jgi:tetratricopeptide (TPR) repeat protein